LSAALNLMNRKWFNVPDSNFGRNFVLTTYPNSIAGIFVVVVAFTVTT